MQLYELSQRYQAILEMAESGSYSPEALEDTIKALDDAIEDKAEGYAVINQHLKNSESLLQGEINRLQERKKSIEKNRKYLNETLKEEMLAMGKQKIKTDKFTIWTQNNPISIQVTDESNIPSEFFEEQQPKLNKNELKDYLQENGEEIEGVELVQTTGVRYR